MKPKHKNLRNLYESILYDRFFKALEADVLPDTLQARRWWSSTFNNLHGGVEEEELLTYNSIPSKNIFQNWMWISHNCMWFYNPNKKILF